MVRQLQWQWQLWQLLWQRACGSRPSNCGVTISIGTAGPWASDPRAGCGSGSGPSKSGHTVKQISSASAGGAIAAPLLPLERLILVLHDRRDAQQGTSEAW